MQLAVTAGVRTRFLPSAVIPSQAVNYRRAADYIAKIFQGENPQDLPVEQPTNMELVINRRSARALGLEIPPDVLVLATRVIE
jgi:putative tryptophan/tyrosine transport system substrate-binding protein